MNRNVSPRAARCFVPAALLLATMACGAGPIEFELKNVPLLPVPIYDLRPKPETTLPRLRCWQHGLSVVDEPIAEGPVASAAPLLNAPGAGGQQVMVLANGTGLCIVTLAPARPIRAPDR